jgi:hypothetical protein
MREGWKCPVCGRGVSPDHGTCDHGGQAAAYQPVSPPGYSPAYIRTARDPMYPPYVFTCGAFSLPDAGARTSGATGNRMSGAIGNA